MMHHYVATMYAYQLLLTSWNLEFNFNCYHEMARRKTNKDKKISSIKSRSIYVVLSNYYWRLSHIRSKKLYIKWKSYEYFKIYDVNRLMEPNFIQMVWFLRTFFRRNSVQKFESTHWSCTRQCSPALTISVSFSVNNSHILKGASKEKQISCKN